MHRKLLQLNQFQEDIEKILTIDCSSPSLPSIASMQLLPISTDSMGSSSK